MVSIFSDYALQLPEYQQIAYTLDVYSVAEIAALSKTDGA